MPAAQRQAQGSQADELRKLKAELKRVTEDRDILKAAAAYFAKPSG
jgi:transposase